MRLFIAIDLPAATKKRINDVIRDLEHQHIMDAKYTDAENLHLTLKFLNEVSSDKVNSIRDALRSIANRTEKFQISLNGLGHFDFRVVWIGGTAGKEVLGLAHILDDELNKLGFAKETRPFAVHLTLARIRHWKNKDKFKELVEKYSGEGFGSFTVAEIKLMKSTLTPQGPIYEVVEEFGLQ